MKQLLDDVKKDKVDMIVVYKIDRLTRSLADFSKLIEILDAHHCSFVSVTQNFNTYDSMGRLTLNILLSFAQFEREVGAERSTRTTANPTRDMNGNVNLDIIVEQIEGAISKNISKGEGLSPILEQRYALNPAYGSYR